MSSHLLDTGRSLRRSESPPSNIREIQAPDEAVARAAEELIAMYGLRAREAAEQRAAELDRQGRWPEHALALRVLNAVEEWLGGR